MSGGSMGAAPQQSQGATAAPANPYGGGPMPFDSTNTTTQADMTGRGMSGAGMGGVGNFFNSMQQGMPQQAMPQRAMQQQQVNPYQQMMGQYGQPQQQINPYQQQRAPQQLSQQMMPQQQQYGLQDMFNRMMGQYNRLQQRSVSPSYRSAALDYRPDMTQATAALSRTANSPVAATQADGQRTAQDEADFQTYLRDQYIKSKQPVYDPGYIG